MLRLHILPTLGQVKLQKLSPQHVQRLYILKKQAGCGPSTIRQMHQILHRALDDALRWNLVSRNVCDVVKRPPVPKKEMQALTTIQAQHLLSAARGDRLEALYVLALTTGMREGELLGLKWVDVDLEVGTVRIQRIVKRVAGQGMVVSEPKTRAGRRHITLSRLGIDALKKHRLRQQEARLLAGARWQDQGWIFSTKWGTPLDADSIRRTCFPQLLARAGLPRIRFHDLRHTAATLLLMLQTHPKIVQELLGHSNNSITLDIYSHVTPSLQKEAVSSLERLLAN